MNDYASTITNAAQHIQNTIGVSKEISPLKTGVILGTGLGETLTGFEESHCIAYSELIGFPTSSAPGHQGALVFGTINQQHVILCKGRFHLYEGYNARQTVMLVYLLKLLGVEKLIVTNASGSLNSQFKPGEVMIINDHINLTGDNPIIGQDDSFGILFPDMSQPYNKSLSAIAYHIASELHIPIHSGVYAGVLGPSLETSAERRYLRTIGADAVGMSTVLEVIAANHCGLDVLGLSAICNMALGEVNQQVDTIEEVLENAKIAGRHIDKVLNQLLTQAT